MPATRVLDTVAGQEYDIFMNSSLNQTLASRWGRLALGVFVFGWMNAVAQPCLMDGSSGAAPSAMSIHGEHGGHAMAHGMGAGDCGHCPPGGHDDGGNCEIVSSAACDAAAEITVDGRTSKLETDDLPDDSEAFVTSADPPPGRIERIEYRPDCRSRILPAGPPLNLRNCVFLK